MNKSTAVLAEDTQAQILQAATERFRHYGYRKTTMAEVARDCSMSAGNLYRYFESKSDIGA
ncbi:MAG: helix-turn-helix transcriptional regulator, partial [Rhodospirillaceae bacterium]|nr:helix-turn-helix transcriptional regulator [Rhodospirillaceae bacterium]